MTKQNQKHRYTYSALPSAAFKIRGPFPTKAFFNGEDKFVVARRMSPKKANIKTRSLDVTNPGDAPHRWQDATITSKKADLVWVRE